MPTGPYFGIFFENLSLNLFLGLRKISQNRVFWRFCRAFHTLNPTSNANSTNITLAGAMGMVLPCITPAMSRVIDPRVIDPGIYYFLGLRKISQNVYFVISRPQSYQQR